MKIGIVGAGSVGCYFGALFSRAGIETSLVARGESLKEIRESGISVTDEKTGENWISKPSAFLRPEEIGPCDILVISVKGFDTGGAAKLAKPMVSKGKTIVLSFQNGIDNEEKIESALGDCSVLPCLVRTGATRISPGKVSIAWPGRIEFGEPDGAESKRTQALSEILAKSGIPFIVQKDIRKAQWKKFLWNVGFNQVCALTGKNCGETVSCKETKELVRLASLEGVFVGRKNGIDLSEEDAESILSLPPGFDVFKPSMLQDRLSGKMMETELFGGAIVELGKRNGVPTPINFSLYSLLLGIQGKTAD